MGVDIEALGTAPGAMQQQPQVSGQAPPVLPERGHGRRRAWTMGAAIEALGTAPGVRRCQFCSSEITVGSGHETWVPTLKLLEQHQQHCRSNPKFRQGGFEFGDGRTYTMFHGTSAANASSIQIQGFRPSVDGMLGPGVYLSRDLRKAKAYGPAMLECSVSLGRVKKITHQGHPYQKTWRQHGYDTAWVPENCGRVASGLEEDCVAHPSRVNVVRRVTQGFAPTAGVGLSR
mmetsp:Transcript_66792/g.215902  ORF Transcript_66792/g.215902 Transcript_66792/m.215902 type:complete len:231 (+) Transcript_66792:15-707(+)